MTFMDKVNGAFSSLIKSFTTDKGDYDPKYDTANHPLGGNKTSMGSTGMLSPAEQQAYDNAVSSGNVNVANHYAIINHHRAIRLEEGNLLKGDIVNLPHLANQVTTTTTDNNDDDNGPSHAEIIANANASQNSASQSTSTQQAANQQAAIDKGVSEEVAKNISGSQMTAGSNVGTGVGGSDISGPMRKGGLASKKKK